MSGGGSNGPDVVLNGGNNRYDRTIAFDAPVAYDTGLYVYPNKTLGQLRSELAVALGYAAQANNLAAAVKAQYDFWLRTAQLNLYNRFRHLRTERWWAWQTTAGKRFYDVPVADTAALNFRLITEAWVADNGGVPMLQWAASTAFALGAYVLPSAQTGLIYKVTTAGTTAASEPAWPTTAGATVTSGTATFTAQEPLEATWHPLTQGVDAGRYSSTDRAMPDCFDVRGQYLELWAPPDQTYVVYLRGHMGLLRLVDESDQCTIDPDTVLLFAVALGKRHLRHPDADVYAQMATRLEREWTAQSHGLRRYIPEEATGGMVVAPDDSARSKPRATWRS